MILLIEKMRKLANKNVCRSNLRRLKNELAARRLFVMAQNRFWSRLLIEIKQKAVPKMAFAEVKFGSVWRGRFWLRHAGSPYKHNIGRIFLGC